MSAPQPAPTGRSRIIIGVVVAVGLFAIVGVATSAQRGSDEKPATQQQPAAPRPASACLIVSEGAIAALNAHMLHGAVVDRAAAVLVKPDEDGTPEWFVAGALGGPGLDGATAVWHTMHDPTVDGENAYLSVDAMAREFSDYVQPEGARAGMLNSDDAVDCLG